MSQLTQETGVTLNWHEILTPTDVVKTVEWGEGRNSSIIIETASTLISGIGQLDYSLQ